MSFEEAVDCFAGYREWYLVPFQYYVSVNNDATSSFRWLLHYALQLSFFNIQHELWTLQLLYAIFHKKKWRLFVVLFYCLYGRINAALNKQTKLQTMFLCINQIISMQLIYFVCNNRINNSLLSFIQQMCWNNFFLCEWTCA